MTDSFLEYPSRGVGPYPIHTLPYLLSSHLTVKVNGTPVSATVDDGAKLVTLAAAAAAGATVRIERTTPRDQDDRLTQFLDLASGAAGLTADLLDQDYRQNLYVMGEARDQAVDLDPADGMALGANGHWAGEGLRIENLAIGVSPNDLITKSQLDDADTNVYNLPAVTGADNDSGLFVNAGAWAVRTPAQARAHLGLGSVATLTAGVAANNVPQLDGSARWPAADGRNIDLANHALLGRRATATVVKFVRTGQGGNSLDATLSTWSQTSSSRFSFTGTTWTNRIELNNSSDVNADLSPGRVDLTAGTWRILWLLKARQTSAAGGNMGFRITNNDDTSSQTIYYDQGVTRLVRQFNAGQNWFGVYTDQLVIASSVPFSLVFRWALGTSGANNDATLGLLFHRVASSVAS